MWRCGGGRTLAHRQAVVARALGYREVVRSTGQLEVLPALQAPQRAVTTGAPAAAHHHPGGHSRTAAAILSGLPPTAPQVPPITEQQLDELVTFMESSSRLVAITGAGISTEAGIPDYRGPQGAYTKHKFKPMTHQQFMAGPAQRARYFARSFYGWHEFANSRPSGSHEGLARLVRGGWISHIITQNVDRLQHKAGTPPDKVMELHGTTHEVKCLSCGHMMTRQALQDQLAQLNPAAAEMASRLAQQALLQPHAQRVVEDTESGREEGKGDGGVAALLSRARPSTQPPAQENQPAPAQLIPVRRPDGDVELQDAGQGFHVPPCPCCGGVLMPDVIFFGANIPPARVQQSLELASSSDLLVVGSSLMVYSAFRLIEACKRNGRRVAVVNVGATRADALVDLKLEVLAGDAMMRAATHPRLLLPRMQ